MQTKIKIVLKPISELKLYENKLRKNEKTVDVLTDSIEKYGFVKPILIDNQCTVVDGEACLKAAIELSMTEVPCIIVDELTETQIKELRIILNRTQEFSSWNYENLAAELAEIDIDLSIYEFPEFDAELSISNEDFFTNEPISKKEAKTVTCPDCGKEFEI